jgi:hypothetical protein
MQKNNILQLAKNVEEIESIRILSKKEIAKLNNLKINKLNKN